MLKVKMRVSRPELMPTKNHPSDACYDLRANLLEWKLLQLEKNPFDQSILKIYLPPLTRITIPTGVYVEVPEGYETEVRPRSGLADRHGITILNTPGTVDAGYRGMIKIIMYNSDPNNSFEISHGDRIAQMKFVQSLLHEIEIVDELSDTDRGSKGFGSSGVK